MATLTLAQALFTQGFGTRRECAALARSGRVSVGGIAVDDPDAALDPSALVLNVDGIDWPYQARALLVLNKPAGYECSQKPSNHPSVMTLLPPPLRTRGVQPVGRLDADTTGLLLLTDDGPLLHRLTSPKKHVPKTYIADCAEPVSDAQLAALRAGVVLNDDPAPVRAARAERVADRRLELVLTEGKYHQVKRMVAAAGNHVQALHRAYFGRFALPTALAPGQWRFLTDVEATAAQSTALD